jgi:hypothetical protein
MAWIDADYKFIFVDIGSYGSSNDSTIFRHSNMGKKLENGELNIPIASTLPNDDNGTPMPFVVVGDEAFGISKHVFRPFPRKNFSIKKKFSTIWWNVLSASYQVNGAFLSPH